MDTGGACVVTVITEPPGQWVEQGSYVAWRGYAALEFVALSVVSGTMRGMAHEGLVVRLDPNNVQTSWLLGCAGADRKARNFAVELIRAQVEDYRYLRDAGAPNDALPKTLTARDLQDAWHAHKSERAPWHATYPSKVYLFALQGAHGAYRRWLSGKGGLPRFRSRHDPLSFKVCESVRLDARHLRLPGKQQIRIYRPDPAQARVRRLIRRGKARIVSVKVWRRPDHTWWASLTLELDKARIRRPAPVPDTAAGPVVAGVDLGVKTRAVAADARGRVLAEEPGMRLLRDRAVKLRRAQRQLSRKDRSHGQTVGAGRARRSPSRRREKARLRVARIHRDIANTPATLTHQLTARLTRLGAYVVVEDLAVRGMTTNGGVRKKGLNRAVHDAAMAEIRRQVAYKLPDGRLLAADRWYPSSRLCSRCGSKNHALTLADRYWACDTCGTTHDRDVNAATNLAAWGRRHLAMPDVGTQAGDRDWPGPSESAGSHARRAAHHPAADHVGVAGACDEAGTPHPQTEHVSVGSVGDGPGQGPVAADTRTGATPRATHPR